VAPAKHLDPPHFVLSGSGYLTFAALKIQTWGSAANSVSNN
jgi:hypothetical protein